MMITATTTFTGHGHYKVTLSNELCNEVSYTLTDMQILEDIKEYKRDGVEQELSHFETFQEIEEYLNDKFEELS